MNQYVVFRTKWGWFGLAGNDMGLSCSCLPHPSKAVVKAHLLKGLKNPAFQKSFLAPLQKQLTDYFSGRPIKFNAPLAHNHLSRFTKQVLGACAKIPRGTTITYSQLAARIGRPRAARTVGNALAANPIPLIIPCHRVIRSDGSIGRFSAPGGSALKRKLIAFEKQS